MLCNLTTAPTTSDLRSPSVPTGFAVEPPTYQELQLRETISIVRGVRAIESAWPSQSPRAYLPMPGRGHYNVRRGGVDQYPAKILNNHATNHPGKDDGLADQSSLFPGSGGQTSATKGAASREREMPNMQVRTMPVLLSLPTAAERIASQQARDQEHRNAMLEKRHNKQLLKNSFRVEVGSTSAPTSEPTRRIESEPLEYTRSMAEASNNPPSASPRAPPQPIFVNKDWMSLPEIVVRVGPDLPLQYTTWDLYNLFADYGEVESVELFENSRGTRDGCGKIKFRYNPDPFNFPRSILCILGRRSLDEW